MARQKSSLQDRIEQDKKNSSMNSMEMNEGVIDQLTNGAVTRKKKLNSATEKTKYTLSLTFFGDDYPEVLKAAAKRRGGTVSSYIRTVVNEDLEKQGLI